MWGGKKSRQNRILKSHSGLFDGDNHNAGISECAVRIPRTHLAHTGSEPPFEVTTATLRSSRYLVPKRSKHPTNCVQEYLRLNRLLYDGYKVRAETPQIGRIPATPNACWK